MKRADGFCCATADSGLLLAVEGLRKCGGLGSFDDEGGCGTSNALRKTVQWLREKRASATSKAAGKLILLKGTGFRACVRTKKKPQISPLRFAPAEMTNLFWVSCDFSSRWTALHRSTNLSSRPERSGVERSAVSFLLLTHPLQPVPFVPRISPTETLSNGSCPLDPLFIKNTEPSTDR
jgi:hypothetical protein